MWNVPALRMSCRTMRLRPGYSCLWLSPEPRASAPRRDASPGTCFLFSFFPLSFSPDFPSTWRARDHQLQQVWCLPASFSTLTAAPGSWVIYWARGTLLRASWVLSGAGSWGPIVHLPVITTPPHVSWRTACRGPSNTAVKWITRRAPAAWRGVGGGRW